MRSFVDHTDNCYGHAEEPGGKGSDPVEGTVLRGVQNLVAVNGLHPAPLIGGESRWIPTLAALLCKGDLTERHSCLAGRWPGNGVGRRHRREQSDPLRVEVCGDIRALQQPR